MTQEGKDKQTQFFFFFTYFTYLRFMREGFLEMEFPFC